MKARILGCSGGIGGKDLRTTSILVDHDILIDAGTGVGDLSIAELAQIDHVFITHSHMDHIALLPSLIDTVGDMRSKPLTVYATEATLNILKTHIFNWKIWPDFSEIPDKGNPFLRFHAISVGAAINLDGRAITALPANHTVPAVGYQIDGNIGSMVFTGDTASCDALWQAVNRIPQLRYLIIETAFSNSEQKLAVLSKHLCPATLEQELMKLQSSPEIFITHLKPGHIDKTMQEIGRIAGKHKPQMLQNDQVFEF